MKYFIFTYDGHGLAVAHHLQQEGHEVIAGQVPDKSDVLSASEKESRHEDDYDKKLRLELFDGMVEKMPADKLIERMKKINNPQDYFVFFDFNNLFKFADQVRDLGFHGNFPTAEDHSFEINRDQAKDFVKKHYPKLHVTEIKEFHKINEAVKFIKESDEIWVIKGYDDEAETFVPESDDLELAREQLLEALEAYKRGYESQGFLLELLVRPIIELTPEKIYYDGVALATILDIENKPLGSGNLSIQTGCSADLVFPTNMTDRINEIAFPPIVDEMAKQHKGLFIWDASILINKRNGKMYFGEFCSNRPGYNCFFTELAQAASVNDFFENLTHKIHPLTLGTVATSMRIFNLNRSVDDKYIESGVTINYKTEIWKDVWLFDALKKGGKIVSAGYDWNLAVVTGSGNSINEAVNRMYNNLSKFSFLGGYYRPKDDYLSLDYQTSILNRLNYGLDRRLYQLPFNVRIGEIK
ncbi:hypothetical protein HY358_01660 [Candidatus Roizmanbacteria bacterium]|nr:hypothetical protein [Candidatus Roizmanbacteria bacterium]